MSFRMVDGPVIVIIDDDEADRDSLQYVVGSLGYPIRSYASARAFLDDHDPAQTGCVLLDECLPGLTGCELLDVLKKNETALSTILITGKPAMSTGVQAMKAGAEDCLAKPVAAQELLMKVGKALEVSVDRAKANADRKDFERRLESLTFRQRQVHALMLRHLSNNEIAAELGITRKTVEAHRAEVMKKMGVRSFGELVRLCARYAGDGPLPAGIGTPPTG
jgi:two-component system response regulator FixJ